MSAEDITKEVIVLDDDDEEDMKPNEYFTFDTNYNHFLSALDESPPIVLSDEEVKSTPNIRQLKKNQSDTSTYPYKCGACSFGSKHRFVIRNHYQMNHVSETAVQTILIIDNSPPQSPTPKVHTVGPPPSKVVKISSNIEPRVYKRELFECEKCAFRTYNLKDMQRHEKMHLLMFPYKCNMCDFAAQNSFTVFNHYQLNHVNDLSCMSDALFECHVCGYTTDDKEVYNVHAFNCYIRKFCSVINESTTNGESFYCSMCSFKASHSFILTNHIRMAHEFTDDSVKPETDIYSLSSMYVIKDEFVIAES